MGHILDGQDFSMRKLANGDEQELKRFYRFFFPHGLSFALNYVPDEEACRDIVQDVSIAYWERRADFSDVISLKVFLYRSIRNRCYNALRQTRLHEAVSLDDSIDKLFSEDELERNVIREEVGMMVHQAVSRLTPQARKVLMLSLQGKTNREIAEILGLSLNTIKSHKLSAYAFLRQHLNDLHNLLCLLLLGC